MWSENPHNRWQIWDLIPVTAGGTPMPPHRPFEAEGPGPLPLYKEAPGQPHVRTHSVEYERDELGTVVNEVTVVTTTITTRKRFRVEDT